MSEADKRIAELLDSWLASVELHAGYLKLDATSYAKVQDWPKHERPSRWVVDLARTRINELKRLHAERIEQGDQGFAEALELMGFLANLVGSQNVERFIPLATPPPAGGRTAGRTATSATPAEPAPVDPTIVQAKAVRAQAPAAPAKSQDRSRPASKPGTRKATTAQSPAAQPSAAPRPAAAVKPAPAAKSEPAARPASSSKPAGAPAVAATSADRMTALVIADAVRMLNWGREWPQIAGLIARLADRPGEQEIWKILRAHRGEIEAQARRPPD